MNPFAPRTTGPDYDGMEQDEYVYPCLLNITSRWKWTDEAIKSYKTMIIASATESAHVLKGLYPNRKLLGDLFIQTSDQLAVEVFSIADSCILVIISTNIPPHLFSMVASELFADIFVERVYLLEVSGFDHNMIKNEAPFVQLRTSKVTPSSTQIVANSDKMTMLSGIGASLMSLLEFKQLDAVAYQVFQDIDFVSSFQDALKKLIFDAGLTYPTDALFAKAIKGVGHKARVLENMFT